MSTVWIVLKLSVVYCLAQSALMWAVKKAALNMQQYRNSKKGEPFTTTVVFNLPYIKVNVIGQIWSHGHIKINAIEEVDNVGAYVSKYMTKDAADGSQDRLARNKSYFRSRDFREPKEIKLLADSKECKLLDKLVNEISESVK